MAFCLACKNSLPVSWEAAKPAWKNNVEGGRAPWASLNLLSSLSPSFLSSFIFDPIRLRLNVLRWEKRIPFPSLSSCSSFFADWAPGACKWFFDNRDEEEEIEVEGKMTLFCLSLLLRAFSTLTCPTESSCWGVHTPNWSWRSLAIEGVTSGSSRMGVKWGLKPLFSNRV